MGEHIVKLLENYWITFAYGTLNTLILAVVGTVFGAFIGVFIGQLRNIKIEKNDKLIIKILKYLAKFLSWVYVTFFRGTPMMVQAIILFTLSSFWTQITPAPGDWGNIFNGYMYCGMIIITINTGAYMAEIIKSGMNGVDKGQEEASRSLGLSKSQTLWGITLPQAIKNCLPAIGNEYIVNVKDSSVLNVIGLTELFRSVKTATGRNYYVVEGYIIVAVIYLVLTLIAALFLKLMENKLSMPEKVNWFGIRRSTLEKIASFFKKLFSKKEKVEEFKFVEVDSTKYREIPLIDVNNKEDL